MLYTYAVERVALHNLRMTIWLYLYRIYERYVWFILVHQPSLLDMYL